MPALESCRILDPVPERLPQHLIEFYERHAAEGLPLALITVLSTEGSTYSKSGSQMLANSDGDFHGMLSGGCLEGDLAERACHVIESGVDDVVEYDLRGDDDVFGLGVGCEGALRILIQAMHGQNGYEPFATLVRELARKPFVDLSQHCNGALLGETRILAPLRVLILGAGQDAVPLLQFGHSLGWEIDVSDHRPAATARLQTHNATSVHCIPVAKLAEEIDLDRFDAVIVMSHNLDSDRGYLSALAAARVEFVGLLGPPHRRDRLLSEIGDAANALDGRLRGPVGRQIGGRGPAAIALEIAAELQSHFTFD